MRNRFLLVVLALACARAFPIGRIGNNDQVPGHDGELYDSTLGFIAAVPADFPSVGPADDGSATLWSSESTGAIVQTTSDDGDGDFDPGPQLLSMRASILAKDYPQWTTLNESEIKTALASQYSIQEVGRDQCSFFLIGTSATSYIGIAKWGTHGYVLTVPSSASRIGEKGILTILQSTRIANPCQP